MVHCQGAIFVFVYVSSYVFYVSVLFVWVFSGEALATNGALSRCKFRLLSASVGGLSLAAWDPQVSLHESVSLHEWV